MNLEPTVSVGNIITLLVFLAGLALAWSRIETRIGYIEKWIERADSLNIVESRIEEETRRSERS